MMTMTTTTIMVSLQASWREGQLTFFNSPTVSRHQRAIPFSRLGLSSLPAKANSFCDLLTVKTPPLDGRRCSHRQARQELNPQPLVLETSALTIELLAYLLMQDHELILSRGAGYASCNAGSTY